MASTEQVDDDRRPGTLHLPDSLWKKIAEAKKRGRFASRSDVVEAILNKHPEVLEEDLRTG